MDVMAASLLCGLLRELLLPQVYLGLHVLDSEMRLVLLPSSVNKYLLCSELSSEFC